MILSTPVCCYCDTLLTCEGCGREQPDTPSTPAPTAAGALADEPSELLTNIRTASEIEQERLARKAALRNSAPQETRGDEPVARALLIEQEAKRRCVAAEYSTERLAFEDRSFRHDDRRPWWKARYYSQIEHEIERLENAGFTVQHAALAAPQQSPRLAERLTDVVMMLDTPDAYNREYISAVCRSILSSVVSSTNHCAPESAEPAEVASRPAPEQSVSYYVENYRFEFEDGRSYTPNDQDKALLEDALEGYLALSSKDRGAE